jgi:hypothetical protein
MAITKTWMINALNSYPEADGHTDVVFTIHWSKVATDGTYNANVYNTQSVSLDPGAPFTPYADLTEAQVVGWLESSLGPEQVAAIDAALDQQIENQINPPVVTLPLPWSAPSA